jgi:localization factor PodJL
MSYDQSAAFDTWGMPFSAIRRDTEDMMARRHGENSAYQAWNSVEGQFRDLGHRLERLERSTAGDTTREAVKALHYGLSRLADQITTTASHSATQVTQLAANLEQLARQVGLARVDSEDGQKALEQRLADTRMANQGNAETLTHLLERVEIFAQQRVTEQGENQRRATQIEDCLHRLGDCIVRLEARQPDPMIEHRLGIIERSMTSVAERQQDSDPAALYGASLRALGHRLEKLEESHGPLLGETSHGLARPPSQSVEIQSAPPPGEPPDPKATSALVPQPCTEPPEEFTSETFTPAKGFNSDFSEIFQDLETENYLAQTRRAECDASAKAKAGAPPHYLLYAVIALIVVLIAAMGLAMSWMDRTRPADGSGRASGTTGYSLPLPPTEDATQFVVAPQAIASGAADDYAPRKPEARAEAALGLRALDGADGVPANLPQAVRLLARAAERGQAVAQFRLGTLYDRGQGVPIDGSRAVYWYELAANQGNRKAMHNLAVAYSRGTAGKTNMAEAARWFAKAAMLGLSDSQFNLAMLYERGDGIPQSLPDAYKWYSIAAAAGDGASRMRIAILQTQLSDAEKDAATRSAAAYLPAPLNHTANVLSGELKN